MIGHPPGQSKRLGIAEYPQPGGNLSLVHGGSTVRGQPFDEVVGYEGGIVLWIITTVGIVCVGTGVGVERGSSVGVTDNIPGVSEIGGMREFGFLLFKNNPLFANTTPIIIKKIAAIIAAIIVFKE